MKVEQDVKQMSIFDKVRSTCWRLIPIALFDNRAVEDSVKHDKETACTVTWKLNRCWIL